MRPLTLLYEVNYLYRGFLAVPRDKFGLYRLLAIDGERSLFKPFSHSSEFALQVKALLLKPLGNLALAVILPLFSPVCMAIALYNLYESDYDNVMDCLAASALCLGGAVYFPVNAVFELLKTSFKLLIGVIATVADACGLWEESITAVSYGA